MIDQDFCDFLEYEICNALSISNIEEAKGFWCDGVLLPTFENRYSKKFVNDNRKIIMIAFIGKTGADEYELTLNLGRKALSKYARGLDILDCIPDHTNHNWFSIDILKKKLTVQLN